MGITPDSKTQIFKLGMLEGWLSAAGNVVLFAIKLWAGLVSSSIALVADAWHTLSDTISSVIILIGIKIASKPADKQHPYGHGRAELMATFIIAIMLVLVGIHFITHSFERLETKERANFGPIAIIVTIVSIVVKEAMSQYAFWVARKTNADSIRADGWHHRSDAISSVIILVGIFSQDYLWWIDGVLGILVSLVIFYSAFTIFRKNINEFLGTEPEPEIVNEVKKIAREVYPHNLRLHHFHIHQYGFHKEMTFHIVLPKDMKLDRAGKITNTLFQDIKEKMDILATIHIDTDSKY
jgi:cation diffusion facilitator family transporter